MAAAGEALRHSVSLEERLAAQFSTAQWVLAGCHERALTLLESHFEAEEQTRGEIARLRTENYTLCNRLASAGADLTNGGDASAGGNAIFGSSAPGADGDASAGGAASPPPAAASSSASMQQRYQKPQLQPASSSSASASSSSTAVPTLNSANHLSISSSTSTCSRVNQLRFGNLPGELSDSGASFQEVSFLPKGQAAPGQSATSDKAGLSTLCEGDDLLPSDFDNVAGLGLGCRTKTNCSESDYHTDSRRTTVQSNAYHPAIGVANSFCMSTDTLEPYLQHEAPKWGPKDDKEVRELKRFELLPVWTQDHFHRAITSVDKKKMSTAAVLHQGLSPDSPGPKQWVVPSSLPHQSQTSKDIRLRQMQHMHSLAYKAPGCMLHPNTGMRTGWDFISLLLVAYDAVMIPMGLFNLPKNTFLSFMIWTTRIFWTFDIPISFLTGYLRIDGHIEMKPSKVAARYVKSWFALDCVLVGIDWLEIMFAHTATLGVARLGKASRIIRIVRMLRLLRLLRMREVLSLAIERVRSERLVIAVDVTKIIVTIVGLAHFIACFWYGIGASDDRRSWPIDTFRGNESIGLIYAMSLHWSLAQFAGGMDEVTPENFGERVYAIVVFLVCFIFAAVLVSNLTSSMTQLHIISSGQAKAFTVLRRYLIDNRISHMLSLRVERNARHTLSEQARFMPETSVELLSKVSEPLRVELHFEIYSPLLATHPFFDCYIEECPQVMRKVCHHSNSMSFVSRGDVIFNSGEIPAQPRMYLICSGSLRYTSLSGEETLVHESNWIAEPTLWTHWMHRGTLEAIAECRLMHLDARKFQDIVGHFHHPHFNPKMYATKFLKLLNAYDGEHSDLSTGGEYEAMQSLKPRPPPQSKAKSVLYNLQEKLQPKRQFSVLQGTFSDVRERSGSLTGIVEVQ